MERCHGTLMMNDKIKPGELGISEAVIRMPMKPKICLSSLLTFEPNMRIIKSEAPVVTHLTNLHFLGCFATLAKIKERNKFSSGTSVFTRRKDTMSNECLRLLQSSNNENSTIKYDSSAITICTAQQMMSLVCRLQCQKSSCI